MENKIKGLIDHANILCSLMLDEIRKLSGDGKLHGIENKVTSLMSTLKLIEKELK